MAVHQEGSFKLSVAIVTNQRQNQQNAHRTVKRQKHHMIDVPYPNPKTTGSDIEGPYLLNEIVHYSGSS